jgi:hypothetical protein
LDMIKLFGHIALLARIDLLMRQLLIATHTCGTSTGFSTV